LEDPRIGTVLNGRYRIIERIASGGMGIVYRGERIELGKPVAVKFIQEVFVADEKVMGRFQREARTMSKLSHPNCVSVIDFGVEDTPYIVMDYATGITLRELLATERVTIDRAILIVRQVLAGLGHAHGQGIIHRDIKPQNIILGTATGVGEHVRIFDFGLAKLGDEGAETFHSMTEVVIGTPHYMSPEQSRSSKVDARSDLYSVGVVFFELLTGKRPFAVKETFEVVRMHRETPPPALCEVDPAGTFSKELEAVISKVLAKSPDDRFQTADEFLTALNATPEGTPEEHLRSAETLSLAPGRIVDTQAALLGRLRRMAANVFEHKALLALSVLVLIAGTALWLLFPGSSPGSESDPRAKSRNASGISMRKGTPGEGAPKSDTAPLPEEKAAADPASLVETIADAQALVDKGDRESAISGLKMLRREHPNDANIIYLLGNLYFEKRWWADAMDLYQEAIRLDPVIRRERLLNENVISALVDEKTASRAKAMIVHKIGMAAMPYLKRASIKNESYKVRKRVRTLMKRLSKG
jgi:serine/threonine-protein kinase